MQKCFFIIIGLLFAFINGNSQTLLTLEEAKKLTLANNYGIAVAKNNLAIAKNLTDRKANNFLPTVSAIGGLNSNLGGSAQKFNGGSEVKTSNALTWGANAAIEADYTIVDKRRNLTLAQLKKSASLSDLQLRLTMEDNLFQVYIAFYKVVQLSENLNALRATKKISEEQLRYAEAQVYYGQGNPLKILNTKVNIQRDSVNILNEIVLLENAKRDLNVLMGIQPDKAFQVVVNPDFKEKFSQKSILRKAKNNNLTLLINRQSLSVEQMRLELIDAEKQPTLSAGAAYNFNFSDNPNEAFIINSNARGLAANLSLHWTIFDGSQKIRRQNSILNLANEKLGIDQLELNLKGDIQNAFNNYQNALFILEVEKNALTINQENFEQTAEQFKYGLLTPIEFRQAQLNLLNAQTSLNNAKFSVKLMEMVLKLSGELLVKGSR